ncbi:MAG: hypothetical protein CBC13_03275 [Planctomycetia bacterium TMED53]|nr:MAG: hypothetical protein CBC13_03275 [Planctomycetia bacterium TMED53]
MSSPQKLVLRYQDGEKQLKVPLVDKLVIGRNPGCQIVLSDSSVSSKHAAVVSKGDRWFIADLDSSNGVVVKGQKVKQAQLKDGDQFRIGSTTFVVAVASGSRASKSGGGSAVSSAEAGGGDLVVRRSSAEAVDAGGSVALQTVVFIGILAILFYSSFDLLSNLASDPNSMQIPGDLLKGSGSFEGELPGDRWIQIGEGVTTSLVSGSEAAQGESWLEISGSPAVDGSVRLLWSEHFSVEAGQGLLLSAAMKSSGFDRFGMVVRWTETSDEGSVVIAEEFSLAKPRAGWSRIALESPAAVSDGFASARIGLVGISDREINGTLQVDQWVAKIVDSEPRPAVALQNQSDGQRVSLKFDDRGVGQILRGRLEMISDLRLGLGDQGSNPWGQLLPARKEPFVSGEDGSYRIGFELNENGESAVVQQFARPQDQRIDLSWTVQQSVPSLLVFNINRKRLGLRLGAFFAGAPVMVDVGEGFEILADELSLGEGNQQVVIALPKGINWRGDADLDGNLRVIGDYGVLEAGESIDLSISASSTREQETLNQILVDLEKLLNSRKEGDAYRLIESARSQMGWREDLDSRLKPYEERLEAEIAATKSQLDAVQEDIRRYPGSPAEGFLIEICRDAQQRFSGLDVEARAFKILADIGDRQSVQVEKNAQGRLSMLLGLAEKAVSEERGELARFYYQHVIDSSPGSDSASKAEQGIKIVEAKGI